MLDSVVLPSLIHPLPGGAMNGTNAVTSISIVGDEVISAGIDFILSDGIGMRVGRTGRRITRG